MFFCISSVYFKCLVDERERLMSKRYDHWFQASKVMFTSDADGPDRWLLDLKTLIPGISCKFKEVLNIIQIPKSKLPTTYTATPHPKHRQYILRASIAS